MAACPPDRQLRVLRLALVLAVAAGVVLVVLLDPGVVVGLSADGRLAEGTERWLARYRLVAGGLTLVTGWGAYRSFAHRERALGTLAAHPRLFPRLAAVVLGTAAGLAVAEVWLRVADLAGGVTSTNTDAYGEYARAFRAAVRDQLDRRGYRHTDADPGRGEGAFRVLVVGDSFVFGFGVSDADATLPAALERALAGRPEGLVRCAVSNGGRPGADTRRQLAILEELVPEFDPHLVLLGYYVNDVESPALKDAYFGGRGLLPVLSPNLERRLRVWRLLEGAAVRGLQRLGLRRTYPEQLAHLYEPGGEVWAGHAADLERFVEEAQRPVAAVLFPMLTDLDDYPLEAGHAQVTEVLEGQGVPVLDLRDALRPLSPAARQAAPFDPHLSAAALARCADATAAFLVEQELVPRAP